MIEKQDLNKASNLISNACDKYEDILKSYENCLLKVKEGILVRQTEISDERTQIKGTISALKKERVKDQKRILDLQRRLAYAMEELEQDKSKLLKGDLLMSVNLNSDENNVMDKVDEILSNLKDKIVATTKDNPNSDETSQLVNQITSPRARKLAGKAHK